MNWGIRDIPTPKEMVAALDEWVVGQPAAKKVGFVSRTGIWEQLPLSWARALSSWAL
jgi:ATP-dependent protease Clp ATPase subunit